MKQKVFFLLTLAIVATVSLKAQLNVGSTSPADVSAILQATSTTKGFLPPILTTAQVNAILLPASGLTVYNSTLSQLQVNVGTPNAPSWAVGAGGTNIYWSQVGNAGTVPGTNYIGTTDNVALTFATNGAERARITAAGNVGIGTQTPTHTLEINGSMGITGTNSLQFGVGVTGQDGAAGRIGYQAYTAGALDIVGAGTSGTNRIVKLWDNVTVPGTLGIGTATPAAKLQVISADNLAGTNILDVRAGNQISGIGIGWGGIRSTSTNTNDNFTIDGKGTGVISLNGTTGTGNVGIGTGGPAYKLDVVAPAAAAIIRIGDGATGGGMYFGNSSHGVQRGYPVLGADNNVGLFTTASNIYLAVQVGATNHFVLNSGGFVGIGTGTPATKLQVVSSDNSFATNIIDAQANNLSTGTSLYYQGIRMTGTNTNNNFYLDSKGAGGIFLNANSGTGGVGIGTTAPAATLDVAGNMRIASTAAAPNSDDLLTINGSGILSRRTVASLATQTPDVSIYSTDGTIASNRTVQLAGRSLTFNGIAGNANGGLSLLSGNAGAWSMMGFGRTGIEGSIGISAQGGQYLNAAATGDMLMWTGANNIQIGANGAGAVVLSTGGNEHFRLANNGNIGINNGNPSQALQVNGVIRAGSDNNGSIQLVPGNGSQAGYLRFYRGDGVTSPGYIGYNNSNILYQTENGASHQFNGTAFFSNNVGIYTSTPSQALQVNGNVKAGADNFGSAWLSQGNNSNQSGYLSIYKPDGVTRMGYIGADNTRMYYNAENGVQHYFAGGQGIFENSVGIGTASPAYKLDVVGAASNTIIRVGDGGSGGGIYFGNGNHGVQRGFPTLGSDNNVGLFTSGNIYLSGAGTNTNQFVLTNGGNVGINMGGTSPSRNLQVNASIKAGLDNNSSVILNGGNSNNTGFIEFYKPNGTTRMGYIGYDPNNLLYQAENGAFHYFGGGNVIVGTALGVRMAPSYTIDVSGNVRSSFDMNASAFNLTSDRRLKKHLVPLNSALDKVMQLMPYSYEKKATLAATNYDQKEMGFIAQDVLKIFPELITVGKDADKILAINYMALIPLLTKAIQEQQVQNNTQVAQITGLKQAIVVMAAQNAEIIAHNKLLDAQNTAITAQLSDITALKIAMAQLQSESNKTTVTHAVLPIPVMVKN